MYSNKFTIDDNDNTIPNDDDNDKPITIQAAQHQINAIIVGHTTNYYYINQDLLYQSSQAQI